MPTFDKSDQSMATDFFAVRDSPSIEFGLDESGRIFLEKGEFRMRVQMPAEPDDIGVEFSRPIFKYLL